jgi:hypothetical protein
MSFLSSVFVRTFVIPFLYGSGTQTVTGTVVNYVSGTVSGSATLLFYQKLQFTYR